MPGVQQIPFDRNTAMRHTAAASAAGARSDLQRTAKPLAESRKLQRGRVVSGGALHWSTDVYGFMLIGAARTAGCATSPTSTGAAPDRLRSAVFEPNKFLRACE